MPDSKHFKAPTKPSMAQDVDYEPFEMRLPDEIWMHIPPHLDEKADLARCMRVSPTLRELAAPHLYRTLEWSPIDHNITPIFPLHLPNETDTTNLLNPTGSLSSKLDHFKHIHFLHVHNHYLRQCGPLSDHLDILGLPTLRIRAMRGTSEHDGDISGVCSYIGTPPCRAIVNLAPRKLVLEEVTGRFFSLPSKPINQKRLATLIYEINLDLDDLWELGDLGGHQDNPGPLRDLAFHKSEISDKRAVFLINRILTYEDEARGAYSDTRWLDHFLTRITAVAVQADYAQDILIVNYEQLAWTERSLGSVDGDICRPKEYVQKKLSAQWSRELKDLQTYWEMPEEDRIGKRIRKTIEEAKEVKFTLLSQAQYGWYEEPSDHPRLGPTHDEFPEEKEQIWSEFGPDSEDESMFEDDYDLEDDYMDFDEQGDLDDAYTMGSEPDDYDDYGEYLGEDEEDRYDQDMPF